MGMGAAALVATAATVGAGFAGAAAATGGGAGGTSVDRGAFRGSRCQAEMGAASSGSTAPAACASALRIARIVGQRSALR
jgi:hypothetical protein